MLLWQELWSRPDTPRSTLARYTELNGLAYMAGGLLLFAWPSAPFSLVELGEPGARDLGLLRMLGMAVAVIGWFYVMGGRTHRRSFGLSTFVDRALVPFFLLTPWALGEIELALALPFAVLDPVLGVGALLLWHREATSASAP